METIVNNLKKPFALPLLVVYLFTVTTYIIFLPRHTADRVSKTIGITAIPDKLSSPASSGNFYVKQHGAFKTTVHKRKSNAGLAGITTIVLLLTGLANYKTTLANKVNVIAVRQVCYAQDVLTALCVLRI